ncbi:hypothetical protein Ga0102493_111406 [Erythrobacter litoralis]|jgi:hypothetical protein|uniref:Exopolysaccharide biosynthesis protein n=1 Tax=Erythrobacter litoralis TaxID=39960 RepID=A0A074MFK5_9SPHN|nr:exopolysaccharide biosynthesis protein [Erythrobacter litoralis]AOL22434.1 hypothetical protein Ga0102493_111406 [Erythrobacter litoralis]KEO92254.1 hypothetical protein EH32_00495 [Erythrobacter litoralis]MEE4337781.1 exopolysaccharide biosynthesis protein [Erythrobacter sp.]
MAEDQSRSVRSIGDVVDGIEDVAEREDAVGVGDLAREFGSRSFAPFMLILALVGITPVGTIPSVPTFIALSIALVAGQQAFGREAIWLPDFIRGRSVGSGRLSKGESKLHKVADVLDRLAKKRLTAFASGPALRVVAALIVVLCCFVPVLEFVPFAAAGPFLAIALLSLAMLVRDGLVMLIGGALAIAALFYGGTTLAW